MLLDKKEKEIVKKAVTKQILEDVGGVIGVIVGVAVVIGLLVLCIWGTVKVYGVIENPFLYITTAMAICLSWLGILKFSYIYIDSSIYCNTEYGYAEYPLLNILVPVLNNAVLIGISNIILLLISWVFSNPHIEVSVEFGSKNLSACILTLLMGGLISLIWYFADPFGKWFDNLIDHADRIMRDLRTIKKEEQKNE